MPQEQLLEPVKALDKLKRLISTSPSSPLFSTNSTSFFPRNPIQFIANAPDRKPALSILIRKGVSLNRFTSAGLPLNSTILSCRVMALSQILWWWINFALRWYSNVRIHYAFVSNQCLLRLSHKIGERGDRWEVKGNLGRKSATPRNRPHGLLEWKDSKS